MENHQLIRKCLLIMFMFAGFAALSADNDTDDELIIVKCTTFYELCHSIRKKSKQNRISLKEGFCSAAANQTSTNLSNLMIRADENFSPPLLI